ncbi:BolA/IbaG family iron-sulfur metabolism protein [Enterobacteriaceae endosymbiont of Donacia simplex]|uniref:BolA family protein n=1 Tax=Enterobacteriaceae endosymbiont of Donacia simplex TaxID=2675784 RepID=UPI0014499CD4|nr:BolA family protein [Enterobacteriaceae endosymbiont of Donacia simplex]QJC36508.1 BolA/IbaG family iron-sulfur metabolism protein [Enterobacteriaceae endosymbiont of Donacia simplex]
MIIKRIENKIISKLKPIYLKINNTSQNHDNKKNNFLITHLEIIIVSNLFNNKSLITRHRLIYHIIGNKFKNIHSLSLNTYTLSEWKKFKNI